MVRHLASVLKKIPSIDVAPKSSLHGSAIPVDVKPVDELARCPLTDAKGDPLGKGALLNSILELIISHRNDKKELVHNKALA